MSYLFVHGLGQSAASWNKTINYLKINDTSFCPELSDIIRDMETNYNNLYQKFTEYCKQFSEPIHICGLSLGGILALQYATEHSANVKSLTLIGTQYVMPKKLLAFQNTIFRFMPDSMFQETGFRKKDFISLSNSMMHLDYRNHLESITCPTLILCGKKDSANKKAGISLSKAIPGATFRMIENSGHEVNIDAPESLAKVLHAFWSNLKT